MGRSAVGNELDESGATAHSRPLRRPLRHSVDRQEIVAVHANTWNAVTGASGREGPALATGKTLEGRDRPLVVHHVQDDRRPVHGGEGQRIVKIRLGRRALADPTRGDVVLTLDG